eukprot:1117682-Pyramimonas_sp.AAC.2
MPALWRHARHPYASSGLRGLAPSGWVARAAGGMPALALRAPRGPADVPSHSRASRTSAATPCAAGGGGRPLVHGPSGRHSRRLVLVHGWIHEVWACLGAPAHWMRARGR